MAPRTLAEMCIRVATANIHLINGFGKDMPIIDPFRQILRAVKTAHQLHSIELGSDSESIYQETEEHWKRIITKDFPALHRQHNWAPDKPENWHKVWDRYQRVRAAAEAEAIAKLEAAVAANKQKQEENKATILNASELSKIAREPRKSTHWSTQPRPKNNTFIQKARNQARQETSRFRLATATGKLPVKPGQIQRAPESMVNEARIERQYNPVANSQHIRVPQNKPSSSSLALRAQRQREQKEREERLLRIKSGGTKPRVDENSQTRPTILSFSDEDDSATEVAPKDNDHDDDDLFGEGSLSPATTPPSNSGKGTSSLLDIDSLEASYKEPSGSSKPSGSPPKPLGSLVKQAASPKPSAAKKSGRGTLSLLDIEQLEASKKQSSGSPSSQNSKSPMATTSIDRRRGGLLSAAPTARPGGSPVARASSVTKSLPTTPSTSAGSPPAFSTKTSAIGQRSLSSMTMEDAEKIEANLRATVPGPAGPGQAGGPRRIIKRSRPVDIFMPSKRIRK